jgi:mycothione reductase
MQRQPNDRQDVTDHYDLVIIGTGSGNTIVDEHFDDWKVAFVERGEFGGTCLNRGCIPTKMLVVPADLATDARRGGRLGVDATIDAVRWIDIRDRVFGRIDPIARDGAAYRAGQPNSTVYAGDARFTGDKELTVELPRGRRATLTADRFVIAAGARAHVPDIPGLADVDAQTSDTIMRIDRVPERLVILGGGFVASELAHVFGAFGSQVTIVHRGERLLSTHDVDVSDEFTRQASERFDVRLRSTVPAVVDQHGTALVAVEDADGTISKVECDTILVATGRVPNGEQLGVEVTGVRLDPEGFVQTDATLETSVPGIYALGDIRTPHMLKHVANHEARVVKHNLLHPRDPIRVEERFIPHAVFCHPQVAAVGMSEAAARAAGHRVIATRRHYGETAYGWALEDTTSFCKVVADAESRLLLGAHIIGPEASLLIQQLVQGMRFGLTVDQMAKDQMYIHPALSEVVEQALLDVSG